LVWVFAGGGYLYPGRVTGGPDAAGVGGLYF
jgi:hypothetical protein